MVALKIYSLEDVKEEQALSIFSEGKHVIGRGLLGCKDKRVSRNHAEINITEGKAQLTSVHINPCFFIAAEGKTIITLTQESSGIELNDGDKFSFLPSDYWFKIRYDLEDDEISRELNNSNNALNSLSTKRSSSEDRDAKKQRIFEDIQTPELFEDKETPEFLEDKGKQEPEILQLNDDNELCNESKIDGNTTDENVTLEVKEETKQCDTNTNNEVKIEPDLNETVTSDTKADTSDDFNDEANAIISNPTTEKDEQNVPKDPDKPSCSDNNQKVKSRRERCWYGMNCYRKNKDHRDVFSHPGDSDYESDPEDDRPECPFGAVCYRRNINHRRQFKHRNRPAPRPNVYVNNVPVVPAAAVALPAKRKRKQRKLQDSEEFSDEDEYDMDDPFLCDESSDEFELSSDGDDSNSEDESQGVDEGSQELRRLKKEAKRFMVQKK